MLSGRIGGNVETSLKRLKRSNVDDTSSSAMLVFVSGEHVRADISAQGEDCSEVGLQHFVPVIIRELMRRMPPLDATTIDENVDLVSITQYLRN